MSTVTKYSFSQYLQFGKEPVFKGMLAFMSQGLGMDYPGIFTVISFLFNILNLAVALYAVRLFGAGNPVVLFFLLIANHISFNEEINIIRSGLGMVLFLLFLLLLYGNGNKWLALGIAIIAAGIHFSTFIFVLLALPPLLTKLKLKYYIWAFFIAIAIAASGYGILNLGIFGGIDFDRITAYTQHMGWAHYKTGFRPTFVLYNLGFLIFALVFRNKDSRLTDFLLKFYILSSILFFMWFQIPFSDRMGAYGWSVIPFLMYFPLEYKFGERPIAVWTAVGTFAVASFFISQI